MKSTPSFVVPLNVADLSLFAKSLRERLLAAESKGVPSHLALLNHLAKSAGFRNYQALRAAAASDAPAAHKGEGVPIEPPSGVDKTAAKALRQFDRTGRLLKWPTQYAVQRLAIWAIWSRLPGKRELNERAVNEYLARFNAFNDPVTLRRELVNMKLLWRTKDGSVYRKLAAVPPDEVSAFLKMLFAATAG
jgi:hypothetical protein